MLLNCGVGEDSWESLGLWRDPTSPPNGNLSWIFIGRTDANVETPIFWSPDANKCFIGKDPDAGEDWRQEKGMAEDGIIGWHHRLNGYEFEQCLGVGDGKGNLVCCSPWGHKELDTTEWLNWRVQLHYFAWEYSVFRHHLLETVLSPLSVLGTFLKEHLNIFARVYFRAFYSSLLAPSFLPFFSLKYSWFTLLH